MSRRYNRDDLAARIRALHTAGKGRNEIARQLNVGGRIVTELAREQGLTFSRAASKAATAARVADSQERRSQLAARILDAAEQSLDVLEQLPPPTSQIQAEQHARAIGSVARAVESTVRAAPVRDGTELSAENLLSNLATQLAAIPDTYDQATN